MFQVAIKVAQSIVPDVLRPYRYFAAVARERTGQKVIAGPFVGLSYVNRSVGSAYIPKLLGIYERELADVVEEIVAARPPLMIDVGAAEGYYAVGFACRLPNSQMIAFETEQDGRDAVAEMAKVNGVAERVTVRGNCDVGALNAALENQPGAVLIMDVEGYEEVLLDPVAVPALRSITFLCELHEFAVSGISQIIAERFAATHTLELIWAEARSSADFPWSTLITRMLPSRYTEGAVSEMRPEKMSWYFAKPIARG